MPVIPFARMHEGAYGPTINKEHDAGMDFRYQGHVDIEPFEQTIVGTGIKVEIPQGFVGLLKPKGADLHLVGSGVIEWTYQGEVMFRVVNTSARRMTRLRGEYIGQMIIVQNLEPQPMEVDMDMIHTVVTERGSTGGIVTAHLV